jgi:hypothetical protein
VTGGTKEPSGIGFILQSTRYLVEGRLKGQRRRCRTFPDQCTQQTLRFTVQIQMMVYTCMIHFKGIF